MLLNERTAKLLQVGRELGPDASRAREGRKARRYNKFRQAVYFVEEDWERVREAYKERGGNPIKHAFFFALGIISLVLSVLWVVQLIVYVFISPPASLFLNDYFEALAPSITQPPMNHPNPSFITQPPSNHPAPSFITQPPMNHPAPSSITQPRMNHPNPSFITQPPSNRPAPNSSPKPVIHHPLSTSLPLFFIYFEALDNFFPLFGTLTYGIFAFYLLFCVLKASLHTYEISRASYYI